MIAYRGSYNRRTRDWTTMGQAPAAPAPAAPAPAPTAPAPAAPAPAATVVVNPPSFPIIPVLAIAGVGIALIALAGASRR